MRCLAIAVVVLVGLAVCGGYWLGFRHAWNLGLQAEAPIRATLAIGKLKLLDQGRVSDLKTIHESDIDLGLIAWDQLENHPSYPMLNILSGHDVLPQYEQYLKRVAAYRKSNKSPFSDPALTESMLKSAQEADPDIAIELEEGGRQIEEAIDRMVKKHGQ